MIEDRIFKKSEVCIDKLEAYGFKKIDNKYYYEKEIMNQFRVEIVISDKVSGKIIELDFDEEYTNYRLDKNMGEFASRVRSEYENILNDIKKNCFIEKNFIYDQTNRIANMIFDTYKDLPEFPWNEDNGAVFRNPRTKKWYALIMNINKKKIDIEDKDIEVINIKLDPNEIDELVKKKGYYRAYHMNKKYWITITLDDTLNDQEIMNLICESHMYTEGK